MEKVYKAIISNKQIYREIELSGETDRITAGNTKDCNVRFRNELFFSEFKIAFENTGGGWALNCDQNVYLSADGVMKLVSKTLSHGDDLTVKYQDSNREVFKISFMLDFDVENKIFDRGINIHNCSEITIGAGKDCNIILNDDLLGKDTVTLKKKEDGFWIYDNRTKYGVYVNGRKIHESSLLKDYDFFTVIGYSFYYKDHKLYTSKSKNLTINGLSFFDISEEESHMRYPKFNRNTRIRYQIPEDEIEILPPEAKREKSKKSLALTLIPSIVMLAMVIVLRGIMGNGGTFVIYSVCSMGLGVIMSVVTFLEDGKAYKKAVKKREEEYLAYIAKKEEEIKQLREYELSVRKKIYLSLEDDIKVIDTFGKRLFEKDEKDTDFLNIYLGTGKIEASCGVKFDKQKYIATDDEFLDMPEQIAEKYRFIENAPILSNMKDASGVGVVGPQGLLKNMLENITLDLCARHFYNDVKLFFILDGKCMKETEWIRWLPHVYNEDLNVRNIVCDEESRNVLLEYLYARLSAREAKSEEEKDKNAYHFVVFVFDAEGIYRHPVSKYIENAKDYNFTFVFFEEYEELLPKGCTEIIRLDNGAGFGNILPSSNGERISSFRYPHIDKSVLEKLAVKLSAVCVDEVNLESELTKNITLFQLLDIARASDLDIAARWEESLVYKSMAAPLGVKKKGETVFLDISDKANAHGPHGLVAGTTGSGKSEILQSYVLSMASLFHPYDVGFLIIDFKGGGMANQFKELPHLMGVITNIDGREVNRSLLFIKAELVRRQELFSLCGVNHINDYIKLFKKGEVSCPLPHLIMIVDEFAELKAEYPDFMKEIISAARIGRTLGVHLILATQKPSGVVDNQIWSNSKFKLCLKVQTKEDSNEVIKTPLAAEIVEPGRAYFQVGNNEIFELFQSAYSGARVMDSDSAQQREFDLYEVNTWGKRKRVYTNRSEKKSENDKNQLQALVEYIAGYCSQNNIHPLPGICLPPLAQLLYLTELEEPEQNAAKGIAVPLGIYDDPEQQLQADLRLDLSEGNTYIIGSAQTGKTTLLQTIVYSVMKYYTPEEVNVYIIDAGNMAMKVFEGANHVGGVALAAEDEKIRNLFKLLGGIEKERKAKFAQKGLGTYKAYLEAGFTDLPQIIVMIDNVSVFREHFADLEENLLQLSREGNSVGINLVVTGTQTNSIGYKVLANFGNRIAYCCNDKGEFNNLFGRCRIEPKEIPGRALILKDKRVLEFHTALCAEGAKEIERVERLRHFIEEIKSRYGERRASEIPVVPETILQSRLMETQKELFLQRYTLPVGINYDSVAYEYFNLSAMGFFAVLGKERSGKTNFVRQLLTAIQKTMFVNPAEAYIFDGSERQLAFARDLGFVKNYTIDSADAAVMLDELSETLRARNELYAESENPAELLDKLPLLLIVIENAQLMKAINTNKELTETVLAIIRRYRNMKVCVIFSNIENAPIAFNSGEILKAVKENKKAVVFEDITNIKLFDTSIRQQKIYAKPIRQGDAYLFTGNEIKKIRTIYSDL